jgi:glycosyltransferase involved in cell wall biosynthesis
MHGGGSERQILTILQHLDRSRFEPFLYLIYRTGPLLDQIPDDVPVAAFEERVGASRFYLPGHAHRARVHDMTGFLKEVNAQVCYDRTFLMTLIAADAAQRAGIPNVSTIVTNPLTGFAPVAGRFQWFKRRILRRLYSKSAQVVAVSTGAAEGAAQFYAIARNRIRVLPNGVDMKTIRLAAATNPVQDPWWNSKTLNTLRLVTAGRLNREKGFHVLIEAVNLLRERSTLPPVRLAILGDGTARNELQHQIDGLSLSDQVRLPGFQNNASAWYESADIFVLPSLVEGMPNVLLEAMAVNTPVVSTDCPSGPAEILQQGRLGELVAVNDADSLADGIQHILQDQDAARNRANIAADAVQSDRSAAAAVRDLESVFENC